MMLSGVHGSRLRLGCIVGKSQLTSTSVVGPCSRNSNRTVSTRRRTFTTNSPPPSGDVGGGGPRKSPLTRQASFVGATAEQYKVVERLAELDRRLSYQGWHTLRWTSLILAVAGCGFWIFKENVSSGVGDAASEVTRRTLENEDVQHQASELARGVVYELLNDKRALDLASQFLTEVIQRDTTKIAVIGLVQDVLGRPETEASLRGLVSNVLTHQESAQKAVQFLQHIVAIPESRDALVTVLSAVLAQPTTQAITSGFFKDVMQSDTFTQAANKLGADTVHYLLGNDDLKMTAVLWCNAVLNDPALQSTAGDAVWAAVKGAFVPWRKSKQIVGGGQDVAPPPVPPPATPSSRTVVTPHQPEEAFELAPPPTQFNDNADSFDAPTTTDAPHSAAGITKSVSLPEEVQEIIEQLSENGPGAIPSS